MTNAPVAPPKRGGCAKPIGIGCAVVLLVLAIGGFMAYRAVRGVAERLVAEYTDPAPRALPVLTIDDDEAALVLRRVSDFSAALKENRAAAPLVLSSRDVNVLIQRHPDWTNLAGKVHVSIEGDRIGGQASLALGGAGRLLSGRYLNGSVTLRAGLAAGRLLLFVDAAEVKGRAVPESVMKAIRAKNLAEKAQTDPDVTATIGRLESIEVRDGFLRLDPKPAP